MAKTIKISNETHKKLGKLGKKEQTYEEIIKELISKVSPKCIGSLAER